MEEIWRTLLGLQEDKNSIAARIRAQHGGIGFLPLTQEPKSIFSLARQFHKDMKKTPQEEKTPSGPVIRSLRVTENMPNEMRPIYKRGGDILSRVNCFCTWEIVGYEIVKRNEYGKIIERKPTDSLFVPRTVTTKGSTVESGCLCADPNGECRPK